MTDGIPLVLCAEEAADSVGLSVSTLAKMRLSGEGPTYSKLGRRVVYRPEDLESWIASNRFRSTSEYPAAVIRSQKRRQSLP
jgi:predicted DNA-binding transcriptional regulator AlpA